MLCNAPRVLLRCTLSGRTAPVVRPTRHRHLQANTARRIHIELSPWGEGRNGKGD
jgi:hypothetical protein